MQKVIPNALTIAGVDPSGGAGVLADVKTMSSLGVYATAVIAALTAQNTQCVTAIESVSPDFIKAQIDTLFSDVRIDAVKIGMLSDSQTIRAVADRLCYWKPRWIVLDPVMVAKSGDKLLADEAVETLKRELLPIASIITPNLPEASVLLGREIVCESEMKEAAKALYELTDRQACVYLKGGHLTQADCNDVFFDGKGFTVMKAQRFETKNTHGTGCTLSSAIAALLAKTNCPHQAIEEAKRYISEAIAASGELCVGHGHGPVHHFVRLY